MAAGGANQECSEAGLLVTSAWRLRWRAPELTLVLGERAAELALAHSDEWARLRGEMLALFALNRLGQGVAVAERAIAAMLAAEAVGEVELGWRLRIELANSARVVGTPLTGFALLRPLLESGDTPAGLRGAAMVQLVDCLARLGTVPELTDALAEADQLYQQDRQLEADTVVILRSLLRAAAAGYYRRCGDLRAAVHAAEEGIAVLSDLSDPAADSGYASGRLVLQRVCALFDLDRGREAERVALEFMERPVRSPLANSVGWVKLALATRLHLPLGNVETAAELLRATAHLARRHRSEALLTQSLQSLAHVYELTGELTEALSCLRDAHAAERRHQRAVHGVRMMLLERLSSIQPPGYDTDSGISLRDQVTATLRRGRIRRDIERGSARMDLELASDLVTQTGFLRRLDAVVNEGADTGTHALVLLDLGGPEPADAEPCPEAMLNSLVERVRSRVPSQATLARVNGDELAVLLPGTTREEAERWVAQLRSDINFPVTVNAGVAEHRPGARPEDLFAQADRALAEAKRPAPSPVSAAGSVDTYGTDTGGLHTDRVDIGGTDVSGVDIGGVDLDNTNSDGTASDRADVDRIVRAPADEPLSSDPLLDAPFLGDPRLDDPVSDESFSADRLPEEPSADEPSADEPVRSELVEDEQPGTSAPASITPLPSSAVLGDFGYRLEESLETAVKEKGAEPAEREDDSSWPVFDPTPEPHDDVVVEDRADESAQNDENRSALGESVGPAFFDAPTTQFAAVTNGAEVRTEDDHTDDAGQPESETSFSAAELEDRAARAADLAASGEFELPSGLLPSVVPFVALPDPEPEPTDTAEADPVEITEVRLEPAPEPEPLPEPVADPRDHHDGWPEPDELELSPVVLPTTEPAPEPEAPPAEAEADFDEPDQTHRDSVAELLAQVMAMSKDNRAESRPVSPVADEPESSGSVPVSNNGWTDPADTRSNEPASTQADDSTSAYHSMMAHDFLAEMQRTEVEFTAAAPEPEPEAEPEPEPEDDHATSNGISFGSVLPMAAPDDEEDDYKVPEARADWPPVLTARDLQLPGAARPAEEKLPAPEPEAAPVAELPRNGWASGFPRWQAPAAESAADTVPEPPPAPKQPEPDEEPEHREPSPIPDVPEPQPIPDEPAPDAIPEPPRPLTPPRPESEPSVPQPEVAPAQSEPSSLSQSESERVVEDSDVRHADNEHTPAAQADFQHGDAEPVAADPVADGRATTQTPAEEPAIKQPSTEQSAVEESASQEPVAQETAAAEPTAAVSTEESEAPSATRSRRYLRRSLAAEFAKWASSPEAVADAPAQEEQSAGHGGGDERDSDHSNTDTRDQNGSDGDTGARPTAQVTRSSRVIPLVVRRRSLDEVTETPSADTDAKGVEAAQPAAQDQPAQGETKDETTESDEQQRKRAAGGPSSRRRKASIGLAELLTEAMVAYESSKYEGQNSTVVPDAIALDSMLEQQSQPSVSGSPPSPAVPSSGQETTFLRPREPSYWQQDHQRAEQSGDSLEGSRSASHASGGHQSASPAQPRWRSDLTNSGEHAAPTYDNDWLARTQRAQLSPSASGEYGGGEHRVPFGAAAGPADHQDPSTRHRSPWESAPAAASRAPAVASGETETSAVDLPSNREGGVGGSRPWASHTAADQGWASLDRGNASG